MKFIRLFLISLCLFFLLVPSTTFARRQLRGMTPREWEPYGQLRDEEYIKTSTFRLTRTQEERRPRDARALGPQDLGNPGIARPELINTLRRARKKGYGGGWLWQDMGETADQEEGWIPWMDESTDTTYIRKSMDVQSTEWWEQKYRGQGQRGGWFRARFGASSGGGIRSGGGAAAGAGAATQQQPPSGGGMIQQRGGGM